MWKYLELLDLLKTWTEINKLKSSQVRRLRLRSIWVFNGPTHLFSFLLVDTKKYAWKKESQKPKGRMVGWYEYVFAKMSWPSENIG